jgi:hypothetical protein
MQASKARGVSIAGCRGADRLAAAASAIWRTRLRCLFFPLVLLVPGLSLTACDGPVGPIPGGRLRGADQPCPSAWAAALASEREVELEVDPLAPRSVRIWNLLVGERLFVPGDFLTPIKTWPHRVMADPRVRIRIAGELYRCAARRVVDGAEIEMLRRETGRKYRLEADGWAARSEVWWFELVPRTGDGRDATRENGRVTESAAT